MSAEFLRYPRVFIPQWIEKNQHKITKANVRQNIDAVRYAYLDYLELYQALNSEERKSVTKHTRDIIVDAFDEFIDKLYIEENQAMVDKFKCTGPTLTPLEKWLKAVTGKVDELDLSIMAQFLWQVKRKMNNAAVVYHIMPVFYGKQGGGKSKAIERLLAPLGHLNRPMKFKELEDAQLGVALHKYLVCFFDEMAGAHKADMETIKQVITGERLSVRRMYTQKFGDIPIKSSFIGASNKRLSNIIFDDTGMRRFWEIIALPMLDWQAVNEIDVMAIWHGIDETRERGYTEPFAQQISVIQQQLVNPEPVTLYALEFGIIPEDGTKLVLSQDLYDHYALWVSRSGQKLMSKFVFGKKLNQMGIESSIHRNETGKQLTYYTVNSKMEAITQVLLRSVK